MLKLRQNSPVARLEIYDVSDDGCHEVEAEMGEVM